MSELNQILQYEEQKKEEIAQVRQAAQEAVEKKRVQLRKKLTDDVGLNISESQEIIQKTQAQIKEFENFYQKQQKDELDGLLKKKSAKLEQTIDFAVANFQLFNT